MNVEAERANLSHHIYNLYHDALYHPERFERRGIHIEPIVFYPFDETDHRCNLMVSIARHVLGNRWYFVVTKVLDDVPYLYIGECYANEQ